MVLHRAPPVGENLAVAAWLRPLKPDASRPGRLRDPILLPASMAHVPRTVLLMGNGDGSPGGVQYDANGRVTPGGLSVVYFRLRPGSWLIHNPSAAGVAFSEPTQIGAHQGRWWQVGIEQTVSWGAMGGLWQVHSALPAMELRRVAEEIAALQPPEIEPAADQAPVPPPRASPSCERGGGPGGTHRLHAGPRVPGASRGARLPDAQV